MATVLTAPLHRAAWLRIKWSANLVAEDRMNATCAVVSSGDRYHGKQNFDYLTALSAENVGARGLCMHVVTMPPGGRARPHLHENHESAIYVLSGRAGMWYGE